MHISTQWVPHVWERWTLPQLYNAPEYSSYFAPFEARFTKESYSGHKNVPSCAPIFASIISILKSLVIGAIWLAHSSVIYSRIIIIIFCSKSHHSCFKSHHFSCILHHFCFKYKMRHESPFISTFQRLATRSIKYWYLLNSAISNWLQWSGKWTFGLKSYLCFQVKFGLISDQIALHSVQIPLIILGKRIEMIRHGV